MIQKQNDKPKTCHTPKKQENKSKITLMLFLTFEICESVLRGHSIKFTIMRFLSKSEKGPEIFDSWMLHHSNTSCHAALSVKKYLAKKSISVLPQPPYCLDLCPYDFFLFSKIKSQLCGHCFECVNIQKTVMDQLKALTAEDFQHCSNNVNNVSVKCVVSKGNIL